MIHLALPGAVRGWGKFLFGRSTGKTLHCRIVIEKIAVVEIANVEAINAKVLTIVAWGFRLKLEKRTRFIGDGRLVGAR